MRRVVLLASLGAGASAIAACGSDSGSSDLDGGPTGDAGDPNALTCEHASGSRIKRVLLQHEDGTSDVLRLHDSEIGETCQFGLAADGSLRCIPRADGTPVASGRLMYTDAACTQPVARLDGALADPAPTIMQQLKAADCAQVASHWELGNVQVVEPGVTALYNLDNAGTCSQVLADGNPYVQVTREIPADELVAGTESWVGGRLQIRQVDGDDGSRWCDVIGAMQDQELDHLCGLVYGEDRAIRCLPLQRSTTSVFSDAACTTAFPAVITSPTCDTGYRFTWEGAGECGEVRVRALGAEVTEPIYQMGEMCQQQPLDDEQRVYRVGPAVSGTSFGELTREYLDVGARLERGDLTGAGVRLFRLQWRDTMLDAPCAFDTATDGVERCLPNDTPDSPVADVTTYYSDNACTATVTVGTWTSTCSPGLTPRFARELLDEGARIHPVEGPASALYELDGSGTCVALADLTGLYALGTPLSDTDMIGGEVVIDE